MSCMHIASVYKSPLERVLSSCCMKLYLKYLQMLPVESSLIDLDNTFGELTITMATVGKMLTNISHSHKRFHDCKSRGPKVSIRDRVMVYSSLNNWECV